MEITSDTLRLGKAVRLNRLADKYGLAIMWGKDVWGVYKGPVKKSVDTRDFILRGKTLAELNAFFVGVKTGSE